MRQGAPHHIVWHLHGTIDNATSIILTPDGYSLLYPDKQVEATYGSALHTLRSLLVTHSFLFIGFSLSDEAFGTQLRTMDKIFANSTGPHYVLAAECDSQAIVNRHFSGVEVIPYSDHGKPLLDLLGRLSHVRNSEEQPDFAADARITDNHTLSESEQVNNLAATNEVLLEDEGFDDSCDTPPRITNWVGRFDELQLLNMSSASVIAITGLGGQGKSTLASKYLNDRSSECDIVDWRDCKEEGDILQTHLVRIIERLTKGKTRASDLATERSESVIKLFLTLALPTTGIFVFDNIDHYIDVPRSVAVGSMNELIKAALKGPGPARFIFTCRPHLAYDSDSFLSIELQGLSIDETHDLFRKRNVPIERKAVEDVYELTQGHPLWVNLIATQVSKNKANLSLLLSRIRAGRGTDLPSAMLREIWSTLNYQQRTLLRYLAETVRPETEKQIFEFVRSKLSHNRFSKCMKQLRMLDLIVVKSPPNAVETIELHPLIREFVRNQFTQSERSPFITVIINVFDQLINRLRPHLANLSFDTLQNWTCKVELLINRGDFIDAFNVLSEARHTLLSNGHMEEFVRLGSRLLSNCDWSEPSLNESVEFEDICIGMVLTLATMGRFEDAEDYVRRFEQTTAGSTAKYVCVCDMRTWLFWNEKKYELAKEWGLKGVIAKSSSNVDTRHDCRHNLALAQRDSGDVDQALAYFTKDIPLTQIADPAQIDRQNGGSFYGNIGRCLYFKRDYENALSCLIKSVWLLETERDSLVMVNRGWGGLFLGELFESEGEIKFAYICFRYAGNRWAKVSPMRAEMAQIKVKAIESQVDPAIVSSDDWYIDRLYRNWLESSRKFPIS